MFQDKKFLSLLAFVLIAVGGLVYNLVGGSSKGTAEGADSDSTAINSQVPTARLDSANQRTKLDLQSQLLADPSAEPSFERSGGSGFQTHLPGSTDPYLYSRNNRVEDADLKYVDSAAYKRDYTSRPSGNTGGGNASYNRTSGSVGAALPGRIRAGASGTPTDGMLSERDVTLADIEPRPVPAADPAELVRKKAELEKKVKQAERLQTLLEEYKRDKEAKKILDEDKKVVRRADDAAVVTSLNGPGSSTNGFFGLYTEDARKSRQRQLEQEVGSIPAMVYGDQSIVNQGRVKVRLLEAVTVRGITLPTGTLVYGQGSFSAERVQVVITSIQYENKILPVSMTAYDMDGMAGIYVPNIQGLQDMRQAAGQSASGINLSTGSARNGLAAAGASAAGAAIQGIRQVTQRAATQVKANLKSNYYVLLRSVASPLTGGSLSPAPSAADYRTQPTGNSTLPNQ